MSTIEEIIERLYAGFRSAVPLPGDQPKGKKPPGKQEVERRTAAGLAQLYEAARTERHKHRLGIVSRARVAFGLQKKLLAAGYEPRLVKQVLFAMLTTGFVGR